MEKRVESGDPEGTEETRNGVGPPPILVLPASAERDLTPTREDLGRQGRPFDRRAPFFIGVTGGLGIAVAYVIARAIADITSVLVIIGLGLFIAIGLNPIIEFLKQRGLSRGWAAAVVTLGFVLVVLGFVVAAVSPISHEISALVTNYPRYKQELIRGHGWSSNLVRRFHLTSYLQGKSKISIPTKGALGAGKAILSAGVSTIAVMVLTIYFLIALPYVERLWLSIVPRSRRERTRLLTEEVFGRVGGYMFGNLLTSLVSGVLTYIWLLIFDVPYALLLALFVALFDLIPLVGSTIAGVVVSLVALTKGLPVAIATAGFYVLYRFLEDYLLNPRVMKHTVRVSPGLTIIASLIGASLLGLIGALVAIPVAATVHLLVEEVVVPRQNEH
jgi:predicted PurR-regulated permease PerM